MLGSLPTLGGIVASSMRFLGALASVALLTGCGRGGQAAPPTGISTLTPSTSSAPASPLPSPIVGQVAPCGPFDPPSHPIDPLPASQPGETQVAQGSGCGLGRVPSNGTFTVDSSPNWILRFAYTC